MSGSKEEIDYQALITEFDDTSGDPTSYVCEIHQNQSEAVSVEYFYDLVHRNCTGGGASVLLEIANAISIRLVQQAAEIWNIIPDGESCITPLLQYGIWLVGVSTNTTPSSIAPTRMISDFGCQLLTPNSTIDECCHVLRSEIVFRPSGGYNISNLMTFVHTFINSTVSSDNSYRTASIEQPQFIEDVTVDGDARNNLKEPNRTTPVVPAGAIIQESTEQGGDNDITITGGFLIASLIFVMIGVFFILFRRHRRSSSSSNDRMADADDTFRERGDNDDDDFHVTVVNDPNYNSFPVKRQITCRSCVTESNDAIESELLDNDDHPVSPKYAFDLGQSFKMKVMGTYAPTTIPVVAPYPLGSSNGVFTGNEMDISGCDSEAEDSWAQTDGTVGSLEDRLEEITAEI